MDQDPTGGTDLDGNAAAGLLATVFGADMTAARGRCGTCGAALVLGEVAAYVGGPGTVLRCRGCLEVLVVLVERRGTVCVDLLGLSELDVPDPGAAVGVPGA